MRLHLLTFESQNANQDIEFDHSFPETIIKYHSGCVCQKYLAHFIAIIYGMQPWTIARRTETKLIVLIYYGKLTQLHYSRCCDGT